MTFLSVFFFKGPIFTECVDAAALRPGAETADFSCGRRPRPDCSKDVAGRSQQVENDTRFANEIIVLPHHNTVVQQPHRRRGPRRCQWKGDSNRFIE